GLIEELGDRVLARPEEAIRELIANAADSLEQLPPHQQSNLDIRLITMMKRDPESPGTLRISDTGLGMTFSDVKDRLGKLFSTSKAGVKEVIGRFGIGFYACFPLCTSVEVFTRTRRPN